MFTFVYQWCYQSQDNIDQELKYHYNSVPNFLSVLVKVQWGESGLTHLWSGADGEISVLRISVSVLGAGEWVHRDEHNATRPPQLRANVYLRLATGSDITLTFVVVNV